MVITDDKIEPVGSFVGNETEASEVKLAEFGFILVPDFNFWFPIRPTCEHCRFLVLASAARICMPSSSGVLKRRW